ICSGSKSNPDNWSTRARKGSPAPEPSHDRKSSVTVEPEDKTETRALDVYGTGTQFSDDPAVTDLPSEILDFDLDH
ncbi:hypothetical protein N658DRAFT_559141, partial [Parathielavia hyrcaniae]